ncbi:hypothetical protein PTKU64_94310 (plasmid) [Paraburkholderia terrae]|uniref:Uncharacterized protein n=1 Tax=Paraburkholderia terrae TaxID=311230 RepID=A0ABM7U3L5_9BURK|nr:hypothetical protein [Paraburkholderia terrae]BCZ85756.1 hypothetical protein PTKU64_94310 [Paraburkholderia terrae]
MAITQWLHLSELGSDPWRVDPKWFNRLASLMTSREIEPGDSEECDSMQRLRANMPLFYIGIVCGLWFMLLLPETIGNV